MTKPISEKEFEKFDDEFQFALYLLCQCKDFLIRKSTGDADFELTVKMVDDSIDKLGFVIFGFICCLSSVICLSSPLAVQDY